MSITVPLVKIDVFLVKIAVPFMYIFDAHYVHAGNRDFHKRNIDFPEGNGEIVPSPDTVLVGPIRIGKSHAESVAKYRPDPRAKERPTNAAPRQRTSIRTNVDATGSP